MKVGDEVRDVIARAANRTFDPRLHAVHGTYLFDVQGVGAWRLRVEGGHVALLEGKGSADCIVRCEPEEFIRIARGEQNLLTAYMQGRVEVEGDFALAQVLHGILPRRAAAPEARDVP